MRQIEGILHGSFPLEDLRKGMGRAEGD